jgi:hypothetical protein
MVYTLRVVVRGGDKDDAFDFSVDEAQKIQLLMEAVQSKYGLTTPPRLWIANAANADHLKAQRFIKDCVNDGVLIEYEGEDKTAIEGVGAPSTGGVYTWDDFEKDLNLLLSSEVDVLEGNTIDGSMYASWTEVELEVVQEKKLDLGRLFPFMGREAEVEELGKLLVEYLQWWQLEGDARKDISEAHKLAGFAFFVIGAASGIGKSTFARRAFQELYDLITSADSEKQEYKNLATLLGPCLQCRTLFRITYVDGLLSWEANSPDSSIAMRVLYEFCKRRLIKKDQSFQKFCRSFKQLPASFSLDQVLTFIAARTGSRMFVIHIDETNHLASSGNGQYLVAVMNQLYGVMASTDYFVPCLFSGTNAEFLIGLKQTSQFRVIPINLPPLTDSVMARIFLHVASQVDSDTNYILARLSKVLLRLIAEEGGNPQILKFQVKMMGHLGKGLKDYGDNDIGAVVPGTVPEVQTVMSEPDRATSLPLRNVTDINVKGFHDFMESQSIDLMFALRGALKQTLISSHILSSVEKLQESTPLRRLLLGYALSGEKVSRETRLVDDWTVGDAEKAGYIYLSPIATAVGEKRSNEEVSTKFRVVVPLIFYGFFTEGIVPGDLLDIDFLRQGWYNMSSRDAEKLDMAALAFFVEWYFEKNKEHTQCDIRSVFPLIPGLPPVMLQRPSNFRQISIRFNAEKDFFTNIADKFTEVATFTLGCGNDAFPDAWGHFKQVDSSPFTLFTQSRKTITGGKFTTEDLQQQIGYLNRFTHDWILFVVTDGESSAVIPTQYKTHIFIFDCNTQHLFYGPIITSVRKTVFS